MTKITDINKWKEENTCHITGEAKCIVCGHSWVAVAPAGTVWLTCPCCESEKGGVFKFFVAPPTVFEWSCSCGNSLFKITPDGVWCPNCGTYSNPWGK